MKRSFVLTGLVCLALGLAGCGGGGSSTYTISFDSQGGSSVASITVNSGEVATAPADPTKAGYSFGDWYKEAACLTAYDWSKAVTSDWTLYAKWISGGGDSQGSESSGGEGESSSNEGESSSTDGGSSTTVYFRDAGWWNASAAGTAAYMWNSDTEKNAAWPGVLMTHISYDETNSYNYWSVDAGTYVNIIFARVSGDGATDWGAQTVDISLSSRGTHNMYDISGTTESWGGSKPVTGTWGDYSA